MEGGSISQRKSYTAQFKLDVVEVAKEKGNREAGRLFNVGESSVRDWRKAESVLKTVHKKKRAMRFGRCLWPTIEKRLREWVVNERAKGVSISTVRVLKESIRIAKEDNIKDFKASPSWVFGFMKKNNLSVRFSTSVAQKFTFSEMEAEEIPKEILNTIDSFDVESDEEFLGFE
jgi:transposase-like protein